jgi:Ca-activated chloride channel family protein
MLHKSDYYDLLDLPPDATPEEIRHAYHEAARRLHPDVNKETGANEQFIQIQKAYEILADPKLRTSYDQQLAAEDKAPIVKNIIFSRSALSMINEEQLVYSLLEFSARPEAVPKVDPPINVCLVLDRSTSMQGERMDTVKLTAIELVRQLKPEDMLSIVVFSDRAEVLLSAGRRPDRSLIETQIRMLRPSGGTEIFQGLQTGFQEVQRYSSRTPINHIILLTDGRTYGDEEACLNLADRAAMQGIRITGLGIGSDWNDVFLDEIAARTGGDSSYVARAKEIQTFLKEKFNSFNQIFGEQTTLEMQTGPGVTLNSAYRLQPNAAILPLSDPIRLGSIPKSSKLSILVEFLIAPPEGQPMRLHLAAGTIKTVLISSTNSSVQIPITLSRLVKEASEFELPPPAIFQALSQINLYKMQERAREEVSEGKIQQASVRLQRLATQLISIGERELAQTALMEAERIQQTHVFSAEGEKKIKYGTRSLLLPSRILREVS